MHRNDPAILTRWLGNKTTEIFVSWIRQSDNSLLVAVEDDNILGVSSVTDAGTSPSTTFRLMPDFAESVGPCSERSKPGPQNDAIGDADLSARRQPAASIGLTDTPRMDHPRHIRHQCRLSDVQAPPVA